MHSVYMYVCVYVCIFIYIYMCAYLSDNVYYIYTYIYQYIYVGAARKRYRERDCVLIVGDDVIGRPHVQVMNRTEEWKFSTAQSTYFEISMHPLTDRKWEMDNAMGTRHWQCSRGK